jgi:hypothetical protein
MQQHGTREAFGSATDVKREFKHFFDSFPAVLEWRASSNVLWR